MSNLDSTKLNEKSQENNNDSNDFFDSLDQPLDDATLQEAGDHVQRLNKGMVDPVEHKKEASGESSESDFLDEDLNDAVEKDKALEKQDETALWQSIRCTPQQIDALLKAKAHIFPVNKEKNPLVPKGTHWKEASFSQEELVKHKGPLAIWPASCNLSVIDIDVADANDKVGEEIGKIGPEFCRQESLSRGSHVVFKTDPPIDFNGKWRCGNAHGEIRGKKGYVVLWQPQKWVEGLSKWEGLPNVSEGFEAFVEENKRKGVDPPNRKQDEDFPIKLVEGDINDGICRLVGHYATTCSEDTFNLIVEPLLRAEWERVTTGETAKYEDILRRYATEFGEDETPKSGAEKQRGYRERQKAEYLAWVESCPEHLKSLLMKEWSEGTEAKTMLANEEIAQDFVHVQGRGAYVFDEKGLLHDPSEEDGMEIFTKVVQKNRDALINDLNKIGEPEKTRSLILTKLNSLSDWRVKQVRDALSRQISLSADVPHVSEVELDKRRCFQFENMVYDVNGRVKLSAEEVREAFVFYQEKQGKASPKIWVKQGDPHIAEVRDTIAHFGPSPFRYVLYLLQSAGKEIGIYYDPVSDSAKSAFIKIWQEACGAVHTMRGKTIVSGNNYDMLEVAAAKYMLVAIEEADKIETSLHAGRINEFTTSGEFTLNEKMKKTREAERKGTLLFTAARGIKLDFDAQGILPTEEFINGKHQWAGGRFRSLVEGPQMAMDGALGAFWHSRERREERRPALNELFSWALSLDEWGEGDQEKAYRDLIGYVQQYEPAWKKGLRSEIEISENSEDYVPAVKIEEIVAEWREETKDGKGAALKLFLERNFGARKERLSKSEGQKTVWRGIRLKEQNSE